MALNGLPPRPKAVKVQDLTLKQKYSKANPSCELCALEGLNNSSGLEIHHIIPGGGRTDEVWNLIRICQRHHRECTYHATGVDREKAVGMNLVCIAVKWLKSEVHQEHLPRFEAEMKVDVPSCLRKILNEVVPVWESILGHINKRELPE